MDKLKSMQVFLKVANTGSFSGAAEKLGISKAMTSKYVSDLENNLNVQLLNRTTRRIRLTEEGLTYRDRISEILTEIEETELSVANLSAEPTGTLRIMAPTSFGSFHLTRAIADYRRIYQKVRFDLLLTDATPDIIEEGIDLVIRIGLLEDSSLIARKLSQVRMVICGAPEYLQQHGIPTSPEDLLNHNCLTYTTRHKRSEWLLRSTNEVYPLNIKGDIRSSTGEALRIAAIQGCGLVQLPTYMVGLDIKSGRLQPVLEDYEPPARPVFALYLHRRHLSAKIRTFVDFLQEQYQPEPYWERWTTD